MLRIILKFTSEALRRDRRTDGCSRSRHRGEVQQLDAKAEGLHVFIGGWRRKGGRPSRVSEWSRSCPAGTAHLGLSLGARRSAPPSPSSRSGQGSSALTPLPFAEVRTATVGCTTLSCGSDFQGISFLLDMPRPTNTRGVLGSRYPLADSVSVVRARRREGSRGFRAKTLTPGQTGSHTPLPSLRIPVDLDKLESGVRGQLSTLARTSSKISPI